MFQYVDVKMLQYSHRTVQSCMLSSTGKSFRADIDGWLSVVCGAQLLSETDVALCTRAIHSNYIQYIKRHTN